MRRRFVIITVRLMFFLLSLILGTAFDAETGPTFVPISDKTVCEGDYVILLIYADAESPSDVLDFDIENAPQGVQFAVYGKFG